MESSPGAVPVFLSSASAGSTVPGPALCASRGRVRKCVLVAASRCAGQGDREAFVRRVPRVTEGSWCPRDYSSDRFWLPASRSRFLRTQGQLGPGSAGGTGQSVQECWRPSPLGPLRPQAKLQGTLAYCSPRDEDPLVPVCPGFAPVSH